MRFQINRKEPAATASEHVVQFFDHVQRWPDFMREKIDLRAFFQQIRVHQPTVSCACLGSHRNYLFALVDQWSAGQNLLWHTQKRAPPDRNPSRVQMLKACFAIQHYCQCSHIFWPTFVAKPPTCGDLHGTIYVVEGHSVGRSQCLQGRGQVGRVERDRIDDNACFVKRLLEPGAGNARGLIRVDLENLPRQFGSSQVLCKNLGF